MKVAVRYFTRGGNTKKVADAMAKAAGTTAEPLAVPLDAPVDVLFLGGSVYAFGLDEAIKSYIAQLDATKVKVAAIFGTSAIVKSGNQEIQKLLTEKGILVLPAMFYCRGEFKFMHKGHPNAEDLADATAFAQQVLQKGAK